jgi:hypothetical protein
MIATTTTSSCDTSQYQATKCVLLLLLEEETIHEPHEEQNAKDWPGVGSEQHVPGEMHPQSCVCPTRTLSFWMFETPWYLTSLTIPWRGSTRRLGQVKTISNLHTATGISPSGGIPRREAIRPQSEASARAGNRRGWGYDSWQTGRAIA